MYIDTFPSPLPDAFPLKSLPGRGLPVTPESKDSACNAGGLGSVLELGRLPDRTAAHCSVLALENSMDRPWTCGESDVTGAITPSYSP